ncbi:LytR/AlgR family response regulator transcription factor [Neolewinella agarilytica]|uniref:Two component transcriptional regulator, LytTR family n=1 Tax=Neolewinella agarilytica TaxID=478744 RepID=A0A1H9JEB9_9BACT|nr:LytTR family DNA-binding domain-containing protein [Neolewinella agarilytica]SEQ85180.1 two component transcriptional regulator, LytTR family [Neolewinella agarilytica]
MIDKRIVSLIIDDEANSQENISILLNKYCPQVLVAGTAGNLDAAEKLILKHNPQLVFLDIQLGATTAFTLLEKLKTITFEIIFITAHNNHAVRAFDFAAVDYLLKPIDIDKLIKAVDNATGKIGKKTMQVSMAEMMQQFKSFNKSQQKIGLATSIGYEMVYIKDIMFCMANGSYTDFFFESGEKLTVSKNLKYYENLLVDYNFLRSHNSALVNLSFIKRIERTDGGSLLMENGSLIPVSKTKRKELEDRIKDNKRLI